MKEGTLFPEEVSKYEPFVIRETLNNCIAHQDYTKSGRINVVEIEDEQLIFSNYASFIPGSVEKVVFEDAPEEHYRNPFLVTAMFNFQRDRFFPLPEYDLSEEKVKVTITGKVLDLEFARVLANHSDLNLEQIIVLDKIQKKKNVSNDELLQLRNLGFIEGRKPNLFISSKVAAGTSDEALKAQYIKHRGFDDEHYKRLIIDYIKIYGSANRKDIDSLLFEMLSGRLDNRQKLNKIGNLLGSLRRKKIIINNGSSKKPNYVLL